jgi:drug/metabolite transporter (DMT)-like permease
MTNPITSRLASAPLRWRVVAALGTVYLIWGSTYLAIRFAIETMPPFLMAGVRFFVAGGALYIWMRWHGVPRPTRVQWGSAAIVGALLLVLGNGAVVWAEQLIPSGIAALLVGTVPLWMALLDWARPGGVRPSLGVIAGLLFGFVGVALLVGPAQLAGGSRVNLLGTAVVLVGAVCWASGSLYSRSGRLPSSPLMGTAMEMLAGGALLLGAGLSSGELAQLHLNAISLRSALGLAYLIVFGSLVGFTAYIWLLRAAPPAIVSTYAFVNPIVAVLLGWALASEPLTLRTLLAAAIIVAGVGVITTFQARARRLQSKTALAAPELPPELLPTDVELEPGELGETAGRRG